MAILVVMMILTANFPVTLFILLCVALVDLFLLGLLWYWNVTLNSVTVVNNVIAIGLAVDYSAHIGHAFLMIEPPETHRDRKSTRSELQSRSDLVCRLLLEKKK